MKIQNHASKQRIIHAAALAAAAFIGSAAHASVLYTWNTFAPAGSGTWSDGTQWTASGGTANANNFPGGDPTVIDDAALINPLVGGYGAFTVNYTGMNAATISTLTIKSPLTTASPAPVAGDVITFNATAPLTTTGAMTLTASNTTVGKIVVNANSTNISTAGVAISGAVALNINGTSSFISTGALTSSSANVTFTIANGASASFAGMSAGSGNSVISGTVNGNLTTTSYATNTSADSGNLTISATAGIVNLGNVTFGRSTASVGVNNAGIHIKGGTVSINNLGIATSNSGSVMEVAGGTVTVAGTFNLGQEVTGGRPGQLYVDGGTLADTNAAGIVVAQSSNTTANGGNGTLNVFGGSATFEKITLGANQASTAAAPGTNTANMTILGGSLYVGSGGILGIAAAPVASTSLGSAYTINIGGGVIGAKAAWSSAANINLPAASTANSTLGSSAAPGIATFQAADASANPFDITLAGNLSGAGNLTKTGGGNLTLGGTASYAGATNVNAGALLVNGAITASTATVASTGILGGSGTITPAVINNGTINPGSTGAGSIGNLTMGNGVTFDDNSTYGVDLNATSSDKLVVTGNIALGNNDTLALNILDATTAGVYAIATYTGTETGTFANLPANVSVDYTTNNAITLTVGGGGAVPEPASLTLLTLGAVPLLRRRRKI
jgi:fibronectin-binding autotransporter adhesin